MLGDLLPLIVSNIQCADTLLRMRRVCKDALKLIPLENILGMTRSHFELFYSNRADLDFRINTLSGIPGKIGSAVCNQGTRFILWMEIENNQVHLNSFLQDWTWQQEANMLMKSPLNTQLWVTVGNDGTLYTLSLHERGLLAFTAMHLSGSPSMYTAIDSALLMEKCPSGTASTSRTKVAEYGGETFSFSTRNVLIASWKERSFLILLPRGPHVHRIGAMEIRHDSRFEWWNIEVVRGHGDQLEMGLLSQNKQKVYLIPVCGCSLFVLDLEEEILSPELTGTLPLLPESIAEFKISDNETRILAYDPAGKFYHITRAKMTTLFEQQLGSFFFVGNNAAVAFVEGSCTMVTFNLSFNTPTRRCELDHIPSLVILCDQAIWTVDAYMRTRRLVRAVGC